MSVSKRLCPELLPSVPLDLAFAHLAEFSKLISVISVNPTRHSEWTIKITGSKVTMAELSQLGATGESLVEDSLGEEVFGSDANISEENKTDDEKLTEAGLAVAVVGVVTDIITDDMKHDMAGRETPVTDEEKAGAA